MIEAISHLSFFSENIASKKTRYYSRVKSTLKNKKTFYSLIKSEELIRQRHLWKIEMNCYYKLVAYILLRIRKSNSFFRRLVVFTKFIELELSVHCQNFLLS